ERILDRDGLDPLNRDDVLCPIRIIDVLAVEVGIQRGVVEWNNLPVNLNLELGRRARRADDLPDADVPPAGDIHEDSMAGLQVVELVAEPAAAAGGNEAIAAGVLPASRRRRPEGHVVVTAVPGLPAAAGLLREAIDHTLHGGRLHQPGPRKELVLTVSKVLK